MSIKALLLDCDGVVVDSEMFNFLCWEQALAEIRGNVCLTGLHYSSIIGIPLADIYRVFEQQLQTMFSADEKKHLLVRKNDYYVQQQSCLKAIDGIHAVITQAQQLHWIVCIVSSSVQEKLTCSLATVGLSNVFDYIFCCEKGKTKSYQTVLSQINLQADEVIVIEDSPAGILASQQSNINNIIAITTNFSVQRLQHYAPTRIIAAYSELDLNSI